LIITLAGSEGCVGRGLDRHPAAFSIEPGKRARPCGL